MAAIIRTIRGDIAQGELGPCDAHEHLFLVTPAQPGDEYSDVSKAVEEAARGYRFRTVNVLADDMAYERMRRISKQSLTPTLETSDGRVLPDFDVAQLENFMLRNGLLP